MREILELAVKHSDLMVQIRSSGSGEKISMAVFKSEIEFPSFTAANNFWNTTFSASHDLTRHHESVV